MSQEILLLVQKCAHTFSFYDVASGDALKHIRLPDFPHEFVVDSQNRFAYVGHYGIETSSHKGEGGCSVFVIDPNKKIRLTLTYPASTGRNFNEILRVIDSLQLTEYHSVATPANWQDGDDVVIVPSITDPEVLKAKFPKGYNAVKPYLRMTPQPNK